MSRERKATIGGMASLVLFVAIVVLADRVHWIELTTTRLAYGALLLIVVGLFSAFVGLRSTRPDPDPVSLEEGS